MRRKILIALTIILSIITFSSTINAEEISSSSTKVKITTSDDYVIVEETIILQGTSDKFIEIIRFWIQDNAQDVKISVNNQDLEFETSINIYTINLSTLEIKENSQPTVKINYNLNKDVDYFQKELIRNTTSFQVIFDENILYTSTNLISGTTINVYLYQPTKETSLNWYLILVIIILIILLIIVTLYRIRKPKPEKVKKRAIESEELLKTKKALLMSLLKDIEKKHRSNEISDDTYNKLKEQYKNEAVETMKNLDDITSKVK